MNGYDDIDYLLSLTSDIKEYDFSTLRIVDSGKLLADRYQQPTTNNQQLRAWRKE